MLMPDALSNPRVAGITQRLAQDLGLTTDQALGIVSNLWQESKLQGINEEHPLIPGSRGGFGWAQWTGPRRDQFDQFVQANHLDPTSDEANYKFLVNDLTKNFGGVLDSVRRSANPVAAATAFFPYESGNALMLQHTLPAHTALARQGIQMDNALGFTLPEQQQVAAAGPTPAPEPAPQAEPPAPRGPDPAKALQLLQLALPSHRLEPVDYDPWAVERAGQPTKGPQA
jgi:hypothetical protein